MGEIRTEASDSFGAQGASQDHFLCCISMVSVNITVIIGDDGDGSKYNGQASQERRVCQEGFI